MSDNTLNQYTKSYSRIGDLVGPDSNFFQGTWDFHAGSSSRYDPFIGGYAHIYWTKLPDFLQHTNSLGASGTNDKDAFKWMTMRNFKSLDGISDIELGSEAITAGFTGNEMFAATNMTKGNTEFTLKHQELAGSPIRKLYAAWVHGMRDMDTGIATFNGYTGYDNGYSMQNYTGELLYFVTDPSGGTMANSIEFACYFTNVFPTKVPYAHLNYSSGEHQFTEIDAPFKGIMHISDKIDKLVVDNLDKLVKYRNARSFDPNVGFSNNELAVKSSDPVYGEDDYFTGYKA